LTATAGRTILMRMENRSKPSVVHLEIGATHLAGLRTGDGTGRCVVFAHGLGQTGTSWQPSAERLVARGWTSLCVDARGHGRSGWNPDGVSYSPKQLVDDLHVWAGTFSVKPVLVGASMGGLTGMAAQAQHDCFAALVLVDVTPRWEPEGVERIIAFMRAHAEGFDSPDDAADAIAAYMPHRPRKSADALACLLQADDAGRLRWHWDPRIVDDMHADIEQRQRDLADAASAIKVPTLLLTGSRSDVVSRRTIDEFIALVPHAQHREIAGARHLVAGDDNDAFASAAIDFLEPLALRPAA
jgi:pimeloyl-ACP methyl ester carboxylesterase